MKRIINNLNLASLLLVVMAMSTSCLKDKYVDDGLAGPEIYKSPKLVELAGAPDATTSYQSSSVVAFDIGPNRDTTGLVYVRLAADQPADKDIQVQLELAPTLIEAYNDSNSTSLEPLPTSIYKLSSNELMVTIPKGEREASLDINLIPNDLIDGEYALAFRIKSVSDPEVKISGNFNNMIAFVLVKNIYDGVYEINGKMVDLTNATLTGYYPEEIHLVTTGANSVAMYYPVYHEFYHPISSAGSLSVYGAYSPEFNFDPSGNGKVISVTNYWGNPSSNGRSASINPAGINQWNPATKEMKVSYNLLQPGSTVRTTFEETFTYVGPR